MEVELVKKQLQLIKKHRLMKILGGKILTGLIFFLALFLVALSSSSLLVNQANQRLEQQAALIKGQISSLSKIENKQTYLMAKLSSFKTLLTKQARHQAIAETVFGLLPQGAALKGFEINESGNIQLSGTVPDWLTLKLLTERIREPRAEELAILKADVTKVSYNQGEEIAFDITLQLSGGKGGNEK